MSTPLRVLFVCTANICRSPFMELLTRHLAGAALEVSSAGTHGFDGRPMEPAMVRPLLERAVPADSVEGFRSRPLTADLVGSGDVVLTAEAAHRRWILDDQPAAFRKVFTLGQFAAAVQHAEGATGLELLERAGARRRAADVALDVADPYRRGDAVAATCAEQIEDLLRVVVPALTGSERISA
jgi:sulfate adenylyltransferase